MITIIQNISHLRPDSRLLLFFLWHILTASFSQNNNIFIGGNGDGFTLGSLGASAEIPLPIELISFTGRLVKEGVELNWKTATEKDNDFFTIEESIEGEKFGLLGKVKGAGTTTTLQEYKFVNTKPYSGLSYYRLKQTDLDGKVTYSKVISIYYHDGIQVISVYPNPTYGSDLIIEITGIVNSSSLPVSMLDQSGKVHFFGSIEVDGHKYIKKAIPVHELPEGPYILKVGTESRKILITR